MSDDTDTPNPYRSWPIEEVIRDKFGPNIRRASGLMASDRDMFMASIAVSLKRIADGIKALALVNSLR